MGSENSKSVNGADAQGAGAQASGAKFTREDELQLAVARALDDLRWAIQAFRHFERGPDNDQTCAYFQLVRQERLLTAALANAEARP